MKKKNLIIIGVCLIICAISIAGTYALLTAHTEPKTNSFSSTDVSIVLKEEQFDKEKASSYLPGDLIQKDPTIQNTSEKESVYAAIKVTYQVVEGTTTTNIDQSMFAKYATINEVGIGWSLIATDANGAQLYMYQAEVKASETIQPELFQSVSINKAIEFKEDGTLPSFNIKVEGYATQYEHASLEEAKTSLIKISNMAK